MDELNPQEDIVLSYPNFNIIHFQHLGVFTPYGNLHTVELVKASLVGHQLDRQIKPVVINTRNLKNGLVNGKGQGASVCIRTGFRLDRCVTLDLLGGLCERVDIRDDGTEVELEKCNQPLCDAYL